MLGLLLLPAVAVAVWFGRRQARRFLPGLLIGVGVLLAVSTAWDYERHPTPWACPGEPNCVVIPNHAADALWFAVGAVLLLSGVMVHARRRRAATG